MPGRLGVKPCPCAEGTGFPWGEVRTASPHSGYIVEVKDGHAKVEGQRGPGVTGTEDTDGCRASVACSGISGTHPL